MTRVRLLQLALLAVGLTSLAVVGWYLARFERRPPTRSARAQPSARPSAAPPVEKSTGLRLRMVRTIGAFRQFSIEAPLIEEVDGDSVLSGGVRAQGEGEDGFSYELAAETARGDRDWHKVTLTGAVRIQRSDGLTIEADSAEHFEKEKADVLRGNVRITSGNRQVTSERAEYNSKTRELFLDGNVVIFESGTPRSPARLMRAEHLYHARDRKEVVLRDGVRVVSDGISLIGDRLDAWLADSKLRRVLVRGHGERDILIESWQRGACPDSDRDVPLRLVRMRGLEIDFDEAGEARQAQPADRAHPVLVEGRDGDDLRWSLATRSLLAQLGPGGRIRELQLGGGVEWSEQERRDGGTLASLRTPEATTFFLASGAVGSTTFPAGLEATGSAGERLRGRRGEFTPPRLIVTGAPRLESGGSTVEAERIVLDRVTGAMAARGQVRSETVAASRARSPLGGTGESFLARADALDVEEGGRRAIYRGNARAWQGASVLEADEIRVDTQFEGLEAIGAAHALMARPGGGRSLSSADRIRWSADRVELVGSAHTEGDELRLDAGRIDLWLGPDGRTARRLDAEAGVVAERQGMRATAERLSHDFASSDTTLLGGDRMVHVTGRDGNETWGDRVQLLRQGDQVVIGSGGQGLARTRVGGASGAAR